MGNVASIKTQREVSEQNEAIERKAIPEGQKGKTCSDHSLVLWLAPFIPEAGMAPELLIRKDFMAAICRKFMERWIYTEIPAHSKMTLFVFYRDLFLCSC